MCGVQSSIQAIFETLSVLAGLALPDPSEFWALMLGSLCAVGTALLLFALFLIRRHPLPGENHNAQLLQREDDSGGGHGPDRGSASDRTTEIESPLLLDEE